MSREKKALTLERLGVILVRLSMKKTKPHRRDILNKEYYTRKKALISLGYETYLEYLNSPLYNDIRCRVFAINNNCFVCNEKATEIHHSSYKVNVLKGLDLTKLIPICQSCHQESEFINNTKLAPSLATQRMKLLKQRKMGAKTPAVKKELNRLKTKEQLLTKAQKKKQLSIQKLQEQQKQQDIIEEKWEKYVEIKSNKKDSTKPASSV